MKARQFYMKAGLLLLTLLVAAAVLGCATNNSKGKGTGKGRRINR